MRFDFLGKTVRIAPSCDIRIRIAPYIYIGHRAQIERDVWLSIPIEEVGPPIKGKPIIRIENDTIIGRRSTISGIKYIEIGPNVLFGPNVFVADHSHKFSDPSKPIREQGVTEPGKVIIEEGCWLGHNSVVIAHKGREIRIGRNSVIGANAVVTKSFPSFSVLGGVPARKLSHSSDCQ